MIPVAFDYERAESVDHALALLAEHGDEAKLLAGGHSLLPLMKYRLAAPSLVVDVGRLSSLSYIREDGDHVAIGALTRHRDVEISDLVQAEAGLLAAATSKVGDPQVRHRGTLGGSLAHGDPASDLPAAVIALRGSLVISGPGGNREVEVDEFFTGFLETVLHHDEMLTEVRIPKRPDASWSFQKFNRRAQDWAIVGAAVIVDGSTCGVGLVNMDARPVRAEAVEEAVASGASAEDAAALATDGLEPTGDLNASVDYRCHLARVLTRRGLEESGR